MQIHAVSFKSYRGSIRYIGFVWHTASQALLQSMYICSHKKNRTSTNKVRNMLSWWSVSGSNRWPPACKAGALPAELTPHLDCLINISCTEQLCQCFFSFFDKYLSLLNFLNDKAILAGKGGFAFLYGMYIQKYKMQSPAINVQHAA